METEKTSRESKEQGEIESRSQCHWNAKISVPRQCHGMACFARGEVGGFEVAVPIGRGTRNRPAWQAHNVSREATRCLNGLNSLHASKQSKMSNVNGVWQL